MIERYTSDIPAIPDPNYTWVHPELKKDIFERAMENPDELPENVRLFMQDIFEQKSETDPIEYNYFPELFFKQTNAQAYIDSIAVYDDDGRLNIDLTSDKIGIPYNFNIRNKYAHGEMAGLPGNGSFGEPIEIRLDRKQRLHQVTFGHEIGHYFMRVVEQAGIVGYNNNEEKFCDYFGRRMAMQNKFLSEYFSHKKTIDEAAILEIMSTFRMELDDTLIGLMEIGLLSRRVAVDSYNGKVLNEDYSKKVKRGVFCLHCTQVDGDYNCPDVELPTPLFDFTDRSWGGKLSSCLGEDLYKPEILSTLTKYYVANEVQLVLFRPGDNFEDLEPDTI